MITYVDKLPASWQRSLEKCLRIWSKITALLIQADSAIAILVNNSHGQGGAALVPCVAGRLARASQWFWVPRAKTPKEILAEVSHKKCSFALDLASKGLQNVVSWRICQCVCVSLAFSLFCSLLLTLSFALIPLLFLPEYILKTVLQCSLLQDYSVLY